MHSEVVLVDHRDLDGLMTFALQSMLTSNVPIADVRARVQEGGADDTRAAIDAHFEYADR